MTERKMDIQNTSVFDPLAWVGQQDDAKSMPPTVTPSPQPTVSQPLSQAEELAMAEAVTRELITRNANIAESYDDYVRLGFALANGLAATDVTCIISCAPIAQSIARRPVNASGRNVCVKPTAALR